MANFFFWEETDGGIVFLTTLMSVFSLIIVLLLATNYMKFSTENFHVKESETEIVVFGHNLDCEAISTGKFTCYTVHDQK